jgi:uncharacterized protein with beta-barrel porin domain
MRSESWLAASVVAGAILIFGSSASAQLIDLGTLPGLTPAQASVGTAIDVICPQLVPTNAAQADLSARCADMKLGRLGLSNAGLADVLGKVTSPEASAQSTAIIDTRNAQFRMIAGRLAALRLGASGFSLSGLKLDIDGTMLSAGQLLGIEGRGGGASADGEGFGRLGGFVNGVGSFGRRSETSREAAFDFHTIGVTAGADYRFTDNLVAGLAFSYLRTDAEILAPVGDVDTRSYGLSLYGTYYAGPLYVDGLAGFTWHDYDTTRRIVYAPAPGAPGEAVDRTATGDTDGRQFTINVGTGYDVRLGAATLTPYGRVEYLRLTVDEYTERGALGLDLAIEDQTAESLLTVLGARLAHAFGTPIGVVVPQVRGEWRHEFLNNSQLIRAKFANDPFNVVFTIPTDRPDRDYFAVGAGVSSVFRKGIAAFLDYETLLGLRNVVNHSFTAGVRLEF